MSRIRLTWNNASTTIVEQRVYRSESPLDIDNMPDPLAVLPRRSREYLDSAIEDGLTYYYAVSSVLPDYSELFSEGIEVEATPGGDPYWDKVVALLHFDGDYTDETGRVWSAIPSPAFESGAGVGGSAALAGAVSTAFSADLNVLNSDFTVEFFVRANSWGTWVATSNRNPPIAFGNMSHTSFSNHWSFGPISSGRLALFAYNNNSPIYLTTTGVVPLGELTHVALMRHGNQILMSIGGTVEVVGSVGQIVLGTTNPFTVGRHNNVTRVGLQDELRITKGVARYTENFTPPTEPFPNN